MPSPVGCRSGNKGFGVKFVLRLGGWLTAQRVRFRAQGRLRRIAGGTGPGRSANRGRIVDFRYQRRGANRVKRLVACGGRGYWANLGNYKCAAKELGLDNEVWSAGENNAGERNERKNRHAFGVDLPGLQWL